MNIDKFNKNLKNTTIIIGLSGGSDSVYLLYLLKNLAKKLDIKLVATHINHNLRPSAKKDEEFCEKLAKKLDIKFAVKTIKLKNDSNLEEKCRIERYKFFKEIVKKYNADYIALGHHLNDSIETVLLNLTRGCSLNGLTGITNRNNIIRPLQYITKEKIILSLKKRGIPFITDPTNEENNYSRNKIRNKVIPILKEVNPNLEKTFLNNLQNFNTIYQYIEGIAKKWVSKNLKNNEFSINKFSKLDNVIQNEVLIQLHKQHTQSTIGLSQKNINTIKQIILNNKTNTKGKLGKIEIKIAYKICKLDINKEKKNQTTKVLNIQTLKNTKSILKILEKKKNNTIYVDKNSIAKNFDKNKFNLRNWINGDKFQPLGMKGSKKIQDFFVDKKIPINQRKNMQIITYQKRIIAIGTIIIDDKYKITNNTNEILKLTLR